jgi:serine/threonine-protein kinase
MARVLRLTVLTGPHRKQKFCLHGSAQCVMGRAPDCFVQLAGTDRDQFISRHHCQLVLTESSLVLQDLGSLSGTYLDGKKLAKAELSLPRCDGCNGGACADDAFDQGSLLNIGGTTFRLEVVDCPPKDAPASEPVIRWEKGETAKKNCPLHCG